MNQKLEEKIPPKLQGTLDAAFAKAFALILRKEPELLKRRINGRSWSRTIRYDSIRRM